MAKKQNKNAKNRKKVNSKTNVQAKPKANQTKKATMIPVNTKREPSKSEIKFFRIGIAIIALGLVVAAIVMIVNNYMTQEDVDPYADYNQLQTEELVAITKYVNDTTYGDLDYFIGKSQYEDLRVILNQYDVFYFYFYHSSDLNEEIQTEIDKLEDIIDSPLLFIDLDASENIILLEDTNLTHLNLNADDNDMLLVYDMQPESIEDFFMLYTDVEDIIEQLGNL
ncbi:hypothetical protein [Mariniplasma anaerobium]|uniref:Uncharacterized protein n=1 Tax=Mariniplasma anaerobium TaxID=2735436 RepID=A0A7U9THJ4_9MOLU|nr:hypothetical protein [Mariniplasma anaerobium]BCR35169.1 hypothetical protein MPAN_000620 [Mariniplasma anaerobium]